MNRKTLLELEEGVEYKILGDTKNTKYRVKNKVLEVKEPAIPWMICKERLLVNNFMFEVMNENQNSGQ